MEEDTGIPTRDVQPARGGAWPWHKRRTVVDTPASSGSHRPPITEVGRARLVGNGDHDDWASPWPSDPNESVKVLGSRHVVEPSIQDTEDPEGDESYLCEPGAHDPFAPGTSSFEDDYDDPFVPNGGVSGYDATTSERFAEAMPVHASHRPRHDSNPPHIPSDMPEVDRAKWLTARTRRIEAAVLDVDESDFALDEQSGAFTPSRTGASEGGSTDATTPEGASAGRGPLDRASTVPPATPMGRASVPSGVSSSPTSGLIDNRLPSPQAGLDKAAPVPTVVVRRKVATKGATRATTQRSSRKHVYREVTDADATSVLTPLEVADIVGPSAARDGRWDSEQEGSSIARAQVDPDVADDEVVPVVDEAAQTRAIVTCVTSGDEGPASSNNVSSELIRRYGGRYASVGRRPRADLARAERVAQAVRETGGTRVQNAGAESVDESHDQSNRESARRDTTAIAGRGISGEELDSVINWGERLESESLLCRRAFISAGARRIVDVGCGSGHRSVLFASWGMEVVAIDSDHALLAKARGLAANKDDEIARAKGDVEFVRGSLGAIAPAMGLEKAEALVCADNALTCVETLSDLRTVLRDLGDALVPNGVAVFAFTNYRRLAYRRAQSEEPLVRAAHDGTHVLVNLYDYPNDGQHIDIETISALKAKDGTWTMRATHQRRFILTADLMARELVDAGFDVTETFGSFDGHPAASLNDKQVVIVARRRRRRRR